MQYVAKFFKDDDGIGVEFPDVPGAFTCADNMNEAKEMAKEALDGVLQSMYERHDPLPVAKTAPNVEEGLVPIDVDDGLAVAYSIFGHTYIFVGCSCHHSIFPSFLNLNRLSVIVSFPPIC